MELSTIMPTPIISPANDMVLMESPNNWKKRILMMVEMGMLNAMMRAERISFKKNSMTSTASTILHTKLWDKLSMV